MGLYCAKSLFHQNRKNPSFPGVFLSGTRNPGFKILPRIGNTTPNAAKVFVCSKCDKATNRVQEIQQEIMCDELDTVKGFFYLGDRLNVSGGCEAAVTARTRLGWKKFKECVEILFGKRFSLQMKGKIYKSYVRLTMLYESETWCLRENEV